MRWFTEHSEQRGHCGGQHGRGDVRHFGGRGGFDPRGGFERGGFERGGFERGPGRFGGRYGGGAGRFFETGALRFVILSLIAEAPRHGYEIIKQIEERLGGVYAPSPGVVYPLLTMMEEMGQATVEVEGTRKRYAITEEGSKVLAENKAVVDAIFERMKAAGQQGERKPQILRAVENLRMVLRMKAGTLTDEQVNRVTDILDAAAKEIERA